MAILPVKADFFIAQSHLGPLGGQGLGEKMQLPSSKISGLQGRTRLIFGVIAALVGSLVLTAPSHAVSITIPFVCGAGTYDITYPDSSDTSTNGVVSNGFSCTGDLVIDPSASEIGYEAFYNGGFGGSHITSVFTGENVTIIDDFAFKANIQMTRVTMGDKLTTILYAAFYKNVPDTTLTVVSPGRSLSSIGSLAFFNSNFHVITLPRSLAGATIDNSTFLMSGSDRSPNIAYYCQSYPPGNLHGLTLTEFCLNSATPTGGSAPGVRHLTLHGIGFEVGDSVKLGDETFTAQVLDSATATIDTPGLQLTPGMYVRIVHADGGWAETTLPDPCYEIVGETLTSGSQCVGSVLIPAEVKHIADGAFLGNTDVTSVDFPEGLLTIGANAFDGTNLSSVTIPDSVTDIGIEAFAGNEDGTINHLRNLTTVVIGNGLITVPGDIFARNDALTTVTLGDHVQTIERYAFFRTNLSGITIPASVKVIVENAFDYSNLSSITFAENSQLEEIGTLAFKNTSLASFFIPDSVTAIAPDIFGDNISSTSLTQVSYCYSPAALTYDSLTAGSALGNWSAIKQRVCANGYKLNSLSLSNTLLSDEFNPTQFNYNAPLGVMVESTTITWSLLDQNSSVEIRKGIDHSFEPSGGETETSYFLNTGENLFSLRVTAVDLITVETYTVSIYRESPPVFAPPFFNGGPIDTGQVQVIKTLAASSDGKKVIAGLDNAKIVRTDNGGTTWSLLENAPSQSWYQLASSSNGVNLAGVTGAGQLYFSKDSGSTWSASSLTELDFDEPVPYSLAISGDGKHLIYATEYAVYFSDDSGATFTASRIATVKGVPASTLAPTPEAYLVTISSDGLTMFAASWEHLFKSIDGGITWVEKSSITGLGAHGYNGLFQGSTGGLVVAAVYGDWIYKSIDGGDTFIKLTTIPTLTGTDAPTGYCGITSSGDGLRMLVKSCNGNFGLTIDGGESWVESGNSGGWDGLISADGSAIWISDLVTPGEVQKGTDRPFSVSSGSTLGGTTVIIYGYGFQKGISVDFDGVSATVNSMTETTITVTTPAHSAGTVYITLTNPDSGTATYEAAFTYIAPVVRSSYGGVSIPTATIEQPVRASLTSSIGGSFSAYIPGESSSTNKLIQVAVPGSATSADVTFVLAPISTPTDTTAGFTALKLTAVKTSDGTSVVSFDKPLQITIPAGAQNAPLAWSIDGFSWSTLPKLTSAVLPEGQQDGYFINSDGSFTLFTRHLTIFGLRKAQALLSLSSDITNVQVSKNALLSISGGSGDGTVQYSSTTTSICSVSSVGVVTAISAGSCSITAHKLASGIYIDSTATVSLTISGPVQESAQETKPASILSILSKSTKKVTFKVNLSKAYKSKVAAIELYSKVKGKKKEIVLGRVKLNKSGDATLTVKNLSLKGKVAKVKIGSKYLAAVTLK